MTIINPRKGLLTLLPALGALFEASAAVAGSAELEGLISAYAKASADFDVAAAHLDAIEDIVNAARPVGVCNRALMSGLVGFDKMNAPEYLTTDEDALRANYERHIEFFCIGTAKADARQHMDAAIAELQRQKAHLSAVLAETNYQQLCQDYESLCDAYWETFDGLIAYRPTTPHEATRKAEALPNEAPFEIIKGAA